MCARSDDLSARRKRVLLLTCEALICVVLCFRFGDLCVAVLSPVTNYIDVSVVYNY